MQYSIRRERQWAYTFYSLNMKIALVVGIFANFCPWQKGVKALDSGRINHFFLARLCTVLERCLTFPSWIAKWKGVTSGWLSSLVSWKRQWVVGKNTAHQPNEGCRADGGEMNLDLSLEPWIQLFLGSLCFRMSWLCGPTIFWLSYLNWVSVTCNQ